MSIIWQQKHLPAFGLHTEMKDFPLILLKAGKVNRKTNLQAASELQVFCVYLTEGLIFLAGLTKIILIRLRLLVLF